MDREGIIKSAIEEGVELALTHAMTNGIEIGRAIGHRVDPFIYILKEIRDGIAVCYIPADHSETGKEIIKEFPLNETFDADIAIGNAISVYRDKIIVLSPMMEGNA